MEGQNKNSVVLERVGEGRIILELIKKRKINWELPAEGCSRTGPPKLIHMQGHINLRDWSRQKKISDDRQHCDKWTV